MPGLLRCTHRFVRPDRHGPHPPQPRSGPPTTRSPTDQPATADPVSTMTPEYSWPWTDPGADHPSMTKCRSLPQIPQWLISTSTSPDDGDGTGRERTATFPSPS